MGVLSGLRILSENGLQHRVEWVVVWGMQVVEGEWVGGETNRRGAWGEVS